jgi:restriction system protein
VHNIAVIVQKPVSITLEARAMSINSEISEVTTYYTARTERYRIVVTHKGLNRVQEYTNTSKAIVVQKARAKAADWDQQWKKKLADEQKSKERTQRAQKVEQKNQLSIQQTEGAKKALAALDSLLLHTLDIDDTVDWDKLKDYSPFSVRKPMEPVKVELPERPNG